MANRFQNRDLGIYPIDGVGSVEVSGTIYIHIMFEQHEVVLSDGIWTKSFQPGDMTLAGVSNAQRNEIVELFPELATSEGFERYTSARRCLKNHKAELLMKRVLRGGQARLSFAQNKP